MEICFSRFRDLPQLSSFSFNVEGTVRMRIAAVDLVSNTCFPALAAEELGFYSAEGLDAHI